MSGNKWRKLRYLAQTGVSTVVSMGGAHSNHLHALAYWAQAHQATAHALVRGEPQTTATLNDCQQWGMHLHFVDREAYRLLRESPDAWQKHIYLDDALWLPEGGAGFLALRGVAELIEELPFVPDVVICAAGSGTTVAGLAAALPVTSRVIAVVALKNGDYLVNEVESWWQRAGVKLRAPIDWVFDQHLGGFGKTSPELMQLIEVCSTKLQLPLEPLYTGKVFYALPNLAQRGLIRPEQRIVIVHTGGLQGVRGFS